MRFHRDEMNMSKLLNDTSPEAPTDVIEPATPPTMAPPYNPPFGASASAILTPNGFLAPSYTPPTFSFSTLKPLSFNAASIANALANRPPEPSQFPQEFVKNEFDAENHEWGQWNCREVRLKIRSFLGSMQMTQAEFLKVIDVDASLYRRFMGVKRLEEGKDNPTYKGAAIFFYRRGQKEKMEEALKPKEMTRTAVEEKREKLQLKVKPKEKKRKTAGERQEKAKKARDGKELLRRIEEVELPDVDEEGCVPVYDDCDEIRTKIDEFMGEGLVTKADFLRALGNVNSNSMRRFMSMRRGAGAANEMYRKAYAFFEKKRILDDEEKTVQRLVNEDLQGPEGFPRYGVNMHFIKKVLDH
ncbi:Major Facilitator Superfamily (MFS) [Phytophthora cinnamomi]|uniref:Major Facilitator Superfamily (MFS) n=1 Tax=Phytophthora cinnamomi TaxID=4785 RepID=UPI00355A5858|nr:Major Facilitator Superfamily (MFS) [Phytophthora cinnamomi]